MKIGARSSHLEMSGRHVTQYQLWVLLHVASVIVWVGAGTTLGLATLYAQRAADRPLEALTGFAGWLGPRVFAPSSLAALGFGILAARSGHWGSPLWVRLGIGRVRGLVSAQRCCAIAAAATGPPWRNRGGRTHSAAAFARPR
jgi:hypothetical protein